MEKVQTKMEVDGGKLLVELAVSAADVLHDAIRDTSV
jgi:hypothetical protein